MSDGTYHNKLKKSVDRLQHLRGESLLSAMHQIIELAKANDDGDAAAMFATNLIDAASHHGRLDYEMLGFGELKSLYLSNPDYADLRSDVLWYYKWIAEHLLDRVDVTSGQIESTFTAMEQFYRQEKEGLRPVYGLRCLAAANMGRRSQAELFFEQWRKAEKQDSDDCPACQTQLMVEYFLAVGRIEEAVKAAEPVLKGEQRCEEVPATTFSRLLLPFLLLGDGDTSLFLSSVVRRQVRQVPKLFGYLADHVLFLSVVGLMYTARRLAFIMTGRSEQLTNSMDRFLTARAAWVFLVLWAKQGNKTISLSRRTELGASGQPVPVEKAIQFYETRARDLAAAFDARNGTHRFAQLIQEAEKLSELNPEQNA